MSRWLDGVVRGSIRQRYPVLAGALAMIGLVAWLSSSARVDALPSFTPPMITVQAEAPGMGSAEVEERVTAPLEQALLGTPELVSERSTSSPGLSLIELTFADDADLFRSRQLVSERLAQARERLPAGLPAPELTPISASVGALLRLCFTPGGDDAESMRRLIRFAEWQLRPRLQALEGVSRVTVHGGAALRIEVQPDPTALLARGITLRELERALRGARDPIPLGYMALGAERHSLRLDTAFRVDDLEAVANTPIALREGMPVRVVDVAQVVLGEAPPVGAALYDGKPALYVQIDKLPWADTLRLTADVERTLAELDRELPAGAERHAPLLRQANFVRASFFALGRAMVIGGVLVMLVLVAFLRSARLVAISLAALPLSMLAALGVVLARGATLNGMLLGGLAIVVGEVVDDAIVDVENIWRRLRENAASPAPRAPLEVIREASSEVRSAVVFGTFIIMLILAPLLLLGGVAGRIFSPLAEAYALAMAASLLVALSVTPAACAVFLPRLDLSQVVETALSRRVRRAYDRVLEFAVRRPGRILGASGALSVLGLLLLPQLGGGFLPEFREGVLIADISAWPGTSLEETVRLARQLDARVRGPEGLPHVAARIGRASLDEDAAPIHRIEMDLVLPADADDPEEMSEALAERLAGVPGVRFSIEGFLGERINELLSGERAPLAIKLFGDDLGELRAHARELLPRLQALDGVRSVRAEALVDIPTTDLRIDDAGLAVLGLQQSDVARAAASAGQGLPVAEARAPGGFAVPIVIAAAAERIADVPLLTAAGGVLPLSSVVQIQTGAEPAAIRHENGRRVVTLTASAASAELSTVAERILALLEGALPPQPGSTWQLAGQATERSSASATLVSIVLVTLAAVFACLWLAFGSFVDAAVVLAGLPLGLVGGVLAALLLPGVSMAGLVGFVTLLGLISRNGILLVAHKNQLLSAHPEAPPRELILQAARERLVPILMTAAAAFFGLLPLALSLQAAGSELEAPMALIVCGGLFTSTLLNLLAVPAFYLWRARRGEARA